VHISLAAVLLSLLFAFPAQLPAQEPTDRGEIDDKYKWDITRIYTSNENWEKDFNELKESIPEFEEYRGRLGESGKTLLAFLKKQEEITSTMDKLQVYAGLQHHQDMRISENEGLWQKFLGLGTEIGSATAWVTPEMIAIPREKVEGFFDESKELAVYRHSFDDLWRQQEHVLSEKEERILSLAGDLTAVPSTVFGQMTNAELALHEQSGP